MTIERTLNGKEMILRPEGRLDAITAPELSCWARPWTALTR